MPDVTVTIPTELADEIADPDLGGFGGRHETDVLDDVRDLIVEARRVAETGSYCSVCGHLNPGHYDSCYGVPARSSRLDGDDRNFDNDGVLHHDNDGTFG